jgi:YfiH family protein
MIKSSLLENSYFSNKNDGVDLSNIIRSVYSEKAALLNVARMNQTHSNEVLEVSTEGKYNSDGILTSEKKLILAVKTADCMPVLVTDHKSLAAIHIGWRGLFSNILQEALNKLSGVNTKVSIGPHAKSCCYEVKKDVANIFPDYIETKNNKLYLNLSKSIKDYCEEKKIEIEISEICTVCSDEYFSYRESKSKERQISFIWI